MAASDNVSRSSCWARTSRRLNVVGLSPCPLSAMLEDGNLRDIRISGVEIVRAINYSPADQSWGKFKPALSNLRITQDEITSTVDYDGRCGQPGRDFSYKMRMAWYLRF